MNYLLDKKTIFSNENKSNNGFKFKLIVFILIFLGLFGGIFYALSSSFVIGQTSSVQDKITETKNELPLLVKALSSEEELIKENSLLKKRLDEALPLLTELEVLREEVRVLRNLENEDTISNETKKAKVLTHNDFLEYDNFIIDLGGKEVKEGDIAVIEGNILLGQVVEVLTNSSRVRLFSSGGGKVRVLVGENNIQGNATGLGLGNYLINLPAGVDVNVGDVVRTSARGKEYIVGIVEVIDKSEEVPFQNVYIKPPVNINQLRFIEIENAT